MRKEWLGEFFGDPEGWWHRNKLGNRQFDAMRVWLREAEVIDKNKITPLGARLRRMTVDNPLTWGVIWTNLSRNSELVGWYVRSVAWGAIYSKSELVDMLDHVLAHSSRKNAITALVGLLRDTPLGAGLGLGDIRLKGRSVATISKRGWEDANPLVLLYSLYRYAERVGRHDLSRAELFEAAPEGPHTLFGISRDDLTRMLRGLSMRWDGWLSVELVRDLDNLYLDHSRKSVEVLDLEQGIEVVTG
jgi:phosphoadenosine phosphosulfate reductase